MSQRSSWKDYSKKGLGYGKKGFDKAFKTLDKLGAPVNRLSNRIGSEAFWPTTLDKESDKAARILRSFCKDGFYEQVDAESAIEEQRKQQLEEEYGQKAKIDKPVGKQRVLVKIPSQVIRNAKGIAIFTTMRTGLWFSGAGGSGILMARIPETGEWSPPSGILLHTAALGFLVGVDIYDCVVIINTYDALEGFKKIRATLGGELSVTAGPVGAGGILDSEVHKRQAPIWTYMKSRGFYAGVQVDGTIIVERSDENSRFYDRKITVHEILAGKVTRPPDSIRTLMQTLRAAQGDRDVSDSDLPSGQTPGDVLLADEKEGFGIPAAEDPDPYGVHALEDQGLFIREAGTHNRPDSEVFEFRPSPSSPIYNSFVRQSIDASSPRQSWRASVQSTKSYVSADKGTQTNTKPPLHPPRSESAASSRSLRITADSPSENTWDTPDTSEDHENELEDSSNDFEIHDASNSVATKRDSVRSVLSTPIEENSSAGSNFTRPRLVTIPKRIPPALPPRNPVRRFESPSTQEPLVPEPVSPSISAAEVLAPVDLVDTEYKEDHVEETSQEREAAEEKQEKQQEEKEYLEKETSPDATPTAAEPEHEPEVHNESQVVDKDEFHSTPTSPVEEIKALDLEKEKELTEKELEK
jgi:lipid-binding SYLF domain-containing protein